MKIKYYKGAFYGGLIGAIVWFFMGFMGLPLFLSYMANLWVVKPIVQLFELGSVGALATMFFVCVVSFAIYGLLINMVFNKLRGLRK